MRFFSTQYGLLKELWFRNYNEVNALEILEVSITLFASKTCYLVLQQGCSVIMRISSLF